MKNGRSYRGWAGWAGILLWITGCNGTIGDQPGSSGDGPFGSGKAGQGGANGGGGSGTSATPDDQKGKGDGTALPADDVPVDFFVDIQPILGDYCVRCHGGVRELPVAPKTPLNLQTRDQAAHVLGNAGDLNTSLVWARISTDNPDARMPFGQQPLPADKLNKMRRWILQGAPWPQHWSFAPMKEIDPSTVTVSSEAWVRTPIDRFILNRLDKEKIKPSPEADPVSLIRRVSLDLTGLPPTPQDVQTFVADTSATAYEKVVDRLLASAAFGERWGRHWLDQARYAESDGYERDHFRPNAWRFRDWVIDSFNQDEPFDQFSTEQIAGDLMPGATPLQVAATAFHRATLRNREDGSDPEEDRVKRIIDRAATVGEAWLGLTLGCTQCHSHPYDNIKQKEFYSLYAFFNNAEDSSNYNSVSDDSTGLTVQVPGSNGNPAGTADIIQEKTSNRRKTYLLNRGNFQDPDMSQELQGGTFAALPPLNPRGAQPDRLDLAKWLIRADNPLTPRVAVNTMWAHLFGRGIVASLDDFGTRATLPTHPELLDWLASDFVKNGWKRKRVIKQMVMSATYRQSAAVRADLAMTDPENNWFDRQNRVRVDAEIVIDIYNSAAGILTNKVGGPAVMPPLPTELSELVQGAYGNFNWQDATGADRYRRGVYTLHKRVAMYPNLGVFDWPLSDVSLNGRQRSNTPLQAIDTLHATQFVEAAQAFAKRVQTEKPGTLHDQIVYAFQLAVARAPTDAELTELTALFNDEKTSFTSNATGATKAMGTFVPAGVAAADGAAWVMVASTILNLDEVINRE